MKKIFVLIFLASLLLSLTSCTIGIFFTLHFTETTDVISVRTGQYFTITLTENPSTGYLWEGPFIEDESIVRLVLASRGKSIEAIPNVGEPTESTWEFEALSPGTTTITFRYERPWETIPIKTKIFSVYVR